MPGTTTCEALPFLCLSDVMARQSIQDLASAADFVLARIASDVAVVDARPKAQMRRLLSNQATVAGSYTVATYDTTDFEPGLPSPVWCSQGSGTITPTVAGIYFVEGRLRRDASASSYVLDLQYNGVTQVARKFDTAADGGVTDSLGVQALVVVNFAGTNALRMRFQPTTVASAIRQARFAAQWINRCNPVLNPNPYFEKSVANWHNTAGVNTLTWSTAQKYRGNASLEVTPGAINWSVGNSHFPGIVVGTIYQGVAFVRPATTQNMHAELRWFTAADAFISTTTGATISCTGGAWTMIHVSGTAPATAARCQMVIDHDGAAAVVTYIDDAQVYDACG